MKATLITRCGCTKILDIPYPPQRQICVPLRSDILTPFFDESEPPSTPTLEIRVFELYREYPAGPYGHAQYFERAK